MPTRRARHVVTETNDLANALDDAARRWPDEPSRAKLLLRLVALGHHVVLDRDAQEVRRRRAAVDASSGALTGVYDSKYLDQLRDDWPT